MAIDSERAGRVLAAIRRRASVDTRALAAFRIALGVVLLVDLLRRSGNLVAFYADDGVLPRSALDTQVAASIQTISVHTLSGSATAQAALFVLAGVVAVALVVGYRTTLATAVSFFLLVSLHVRNPAVLHGGDSLLRQLLLWGTLLPLGERWSVDAVRRDDSDCGPRGTVATLATAGVLMQVVLVYATNAVFKFRGDIWLQGNAIERVFGLSRHATPAARLVSEIPLALTVADYLWLALLVASPLLVVVTGWRRGVLAVVYAAFHAGMLLFMELGIFPLVGVAALLLFLPGVVWDRLPAPPDEWFERLATFLPAMSWPSTDVRTRARPLARGVAAVLLVLLFVVNAMSLGFVDAPEGSPAAVENKGWDMFAPYPPSEDGYYVVPATLESGERVDALRREDVSWEPPSDVSQTYGNERWRKLLYQLDEERESALREPLLQHLCWRWNRAHDDEMVQVSLVYVTDPLDGSAGQRIEYASVQCR